MENIKIILKSLRKFNRMTQEELSPKLGISRAYLCEIETGKKKPTLELIYKYSEVFDIEPHLILNIADNKSKVKAKLNKFVCRFLEYIMEE